MNPKGRGGRTTGWSGAGRTGWAWDVGTARVGGGQPGWKPGWSGNKEALPAAGFSGGCHEFFTMGKT